MASIDGFLGDRLRRNVTQWLKTFDIHRHVRQIEAGEGSEAALFAGRWLEASILASEWSGDPLLRQRTSGMLDRILGAQQPGAGDPFPAFRDPAHAAALISALDTAEDIWENGPAASASERLSRFHPAAGAQSAIGFDLASLVLRMPRLQPGVTDDEIESLLWNRILPCQSPEGDAFRAEYTVREFGGEDSGSAGALLLARLPWWLYSVGDEVTVRQFAPSSLKFEVAGARVRLTQMTTYPDGETIELKVEPERPVEFALRLRIPGWAAAPEIRLNGQPASALLTRRWVTGDLVTVRFSMPPVWLDGVGPNLGLIALRRGPLFYALREPPASIRVASRELGSRPGTPARQFSAEFATGTDASFVETLVPLAALGLPGNERAQFAVWLQK